MGRFKHSSPKLPLHMKFTEDYMMLYGYRVKTSANRLKVIRKNPKCVGCGLMADHLRIDVDHGGQIHLNAYAKTGRMMTADHIIPKSGGGGNGMHNLQTMCNKCNSRKGANQVHNFCEVQYA